MTNIHQAAHSRPKNVPISFGFLYYHYSKVGDDNDLEARNAVLESAKHRWAQVDQEVFIAAVILNPLYKDKPFNNIPLTTRANKPSSVLGPLADDSLLQLSVHFQAPVQLTSALQMSCFKCMHSHS